MLKQMRNGWILFNEDEQEVRENLIVALEVLRRRGFMRAMLSLQIKSSFTGRKTN